MNNSENCEVVNVETTLDSRKESTDKLKTLTETKTKNVVEHNTTEEFEIDSDEDSDGTNEFELIHVGRIFKITRKSVEESRIVEACQNRGGMQHQKWRRIFDTIGVVLLEQQQQQ